MSLVENFMAASQQPNTIGLSWSQPIGFNNINSDIIVTKAVSHYPVELYNPTFPTKSTDSRPIELFRGKTIVGLDTGTISVSGDILTDSAANLPTSPNLIGRLVRDSASKVFRIISNTSTSITLNDTPANGKYVILCDFPTNDRLQQNFEIDARTVVGSGFIKNFVRLINGSLVIQAFEEDELVNLVFKDGNNNIFFIKSNTVDTVYFWESLDTPVIGPGMALLQRFVDSRPQVYLDQFKTDIEADSRVGTGLLSNRFYYYTAFTLPVGANVAQAQFGAVDSRTSTQSSAISAADRQFGQLLFKLWPGIHQLLDASGDLEIAMEIFGFQFNELHALIDTYNLQDSDNVFVNAVLPLSEQTGLPSIGFTIGADTLRRISGEMISCWKLKGSKEGIALFIRKLTTWDITNGTANFDDAIQDFLPNVSALRFFASGLGSANTRLTQTDPVVVPGGRFAKSLPGIVIPGFFSFREFVITLPNVALFIGTSQIIIVSNNTTTVIDSTKNFGADNSLVGNFILPNQEEVNDIFEIMANTATTITAKGIFNNKIVGGRYAILSSLNTNRFIVLNKLMSSYQPFKTKAGWNFT